ncbi:transposon Ty3-I Gag-Pol polyprotein [Trichonephila clavipes]|uniref:Transposon Ty3-I Gag-Pol polyprotein n=1 Tax=Trichonephila clavipes TaxID=2585209 RepID=A0A8X6W8H8_TRICX|nr:transposon Ty3-I Gag-Pol polyprotein [Trichonephila clavipes]
MSKKTSDHERKYTSFELEVLEVVEAIKKFRIYVLGTSFKIITDCDALVKTLSKKELNPRSTDAAEVINRLENQRHVYGNPARIITDKGSAFTSSAFEDYCKKQNILHISITTGLPRSNGQIENQNSTINPVLSKLSVDDPEKWYSHVPHLQ